MLLLQGGSILVTFEIITIDHGLDHIYQQYTYHLFCIIRIIQNVSWLLYLFRDHHCYSHHSYVHVDYDGIVVDFIIHYLFLISSWSLYYLFQSRHHYKKHHYPPPPPPPPPPHHHQSSLSRFHSTSPILSMDKNLHRFTANMPSIPTCLEPKLVGDFFNNSFIIIIHVWCCLLLYTIVIHYIYRGRQIESYCHCPESRVLSS